MALSDVRPLQEGLPFGVRVGGITQTLVEDEAVRRELNRLFEQYGMIVFEDVEPTNEMQLKLSTVFGPLKEHPVRKLLRVDADAMPGVIEIRSKPNAGGLVAFDGKQLAYWLPWHFDHCYNDELNRAGVLRPTVIVEEGGLTGFSDGILLYNEFPKDLLARIEDAEIVYTLDVEYETNRFGRPEGFEVIRSKKMGLEDQARSMPRAIHPAVWTRPTGEKVLHISLYMADGILGQENAEGDALYEEACQAVNQLGRTRAYHHRWKPTEMVIWDNWRMLHSVSGNPPEVERVMQRTTIKGDYGFGRFEDGSKGAIPDAMMVD